MAVLRNEWVNTALYNRFHRTNPSGLGYDGELSSVTNSPPLENYSWKSRGKKKKIDDGYIYGI